jgi:acyl carrier protein
MNREQIFSLIRAHLADELEVDPDVINESTRFRQDLEADSLDLYTLVQELEDSYGVKISDEEAAKILTVGQAVDFVLANPATTRARPVLARQPDQAEARPEGRAAAARRLDVQPSATASQGPDSE